MPQRALWFVHNNYQPILLINDYVDLDTLLAAYRGLEKLIETQPLKTIVKQQVFPPTLLNLMEDKDLSE